MTGENMTKEAVESESESPSTYHEKIIGKTLYRVTTIYKGEIDFKKAMEDSIIRRIVNDELSQQK